VPELCRDDPAWTVVEVDDRGRWQRVERVLSPTDVLSRIVVLAPQRRVAGDGLLEPDPYSENQVQGLMVAPDGVIVDDTLGAEESVVATVTRWVANIQAGRQWSARPLRLRDFFTDAMWSPPGERLHVLLTPSAQFAERITSLYGAVLEQWTGMLRVVPRERLHITLAELDLPSAELGGDAVAAACDAVDNVLATVSWEALAELEVEAADATLYRVRCQIDQAEPIDDLGEAVRAALAEVWPAAAVKPTSGGAHIALAHSTGSTADATELRDQLRQAGGDNPLWSRPDMWRLGHPQVQLLHVDPFGEDPWRWRSATP